MTLRGNRGRQQLNPVSRARPPLPTGMDPAARWTPLTWSHPARAVGRGILTSSGPPLGLLTTLSSPGQL